MNTFSTLFSQSAVAPGVGQLADGPGVENPLAKTLPRNMVAVSSSTTVTSRSLTQAAVAPPLPAPGASDQLRGAVDLFFVSVYGPAPPPPPAESVSPFSRAAQFRITAIPLIFLKKCEDSRAHGLYGDGR